MIVGDNRGHKFMPEVTDMIYQLPDGHGDVWIYDDGKEEPALKYEIKFVSDFWNRATSESLNSQLEHVDGLILIGGDAPFDWKRLNNVINGVQDHTRVYRVRDVAHLGEFLRKREEKIKVGNYGLIQKRKRKVKGHPPAVESLTNIDGVSYKIAQRIYDEFDSLADLVAEAKAISNKELSVKKSRFVNVDKVGPVLAMKVVEWAIGPWPKPMSPT